MYMPVPVAVQSEMEVLVTWLLRLLVECCFGHECLSLVFTCFVAPSRGLVMSWSFFQGVLQYVCQK